MAVAFVLAKVTIFCANGFPLPELHTFDSKQPHTNKQSAGTPQNKFSENVEDKFSENVEDKFSENVEDKFSENADPKPIRRNVDYNC